MKQDYGDESLLTSDRLKPVISRKHEQIEEQASSGCCLLRMIAVPIYQEEGRSREGFDTFFFDDDGTEREAGDGIGQKDSKVCLS